MDGRQAGTPGDLAAQNYIASQFEAYGLIPGGDLEESTFFQPFDITTKIMSSAPTLNILGVESTDLIFREDFSPIRFPTGEQTQAQGDLVWVEDYEALEFGEELTGVILVRPISTDLDLEIEQAVNHGAVGILLTGDLHDDEVYSKQPEIYAYPAESPIPVFELTRIGTRKLVAAAGHTNESFSRIAPITQLELSGEMDFNLPGAEILPTANVLGFLPGSDPYLSQEIIIIGAHYDHVGHDPSNGWRFSGGNDNASGVSGLLEIARIWQAFGYQPKRSVLFAAWGAQELNQAGSGYYVQNPIYPLESIVGLIQMDGIAGGDGFYPGIQGEWETDGQLLLRINTEDKWINTSQITPSDHFAFQDYAIPSLLVSWRLANEDNLPDELTNQVILEKFEICTKMALQILMGAAR
jgi:hypothetical protein